MSYITGADISKLLDRIAELEAENKHWGDIARRREDIILNLQNDKVHLEAENAELKKAIEFQKHIFQLASEHRDELDAEIAELRKEKERLAAGIAGAINYSKTGDDSYKTLVWTRNRLRELLEAK